MDSREKEKKCVSICRNKTKKQKNTEVYYSKEFYNFKSKPILVSNSKKMEAYVSH